MHSICEKTGLNINTRRKRACTVEQTHLIDSSMRIAVQDYILNNAAFVPPVAAFQQQQPGLLRLYQGRQSVVSLARHILQPLAPTLCFQYSAKQS